MGDTAMNADIQPDIAGKILRGLRLDSYLLTNTIVI